ncbi:carbohydrate ABC transporter permease [Paenibacillus aurantius]|uniref:Carbohydrate ABC transporter permease n=1 Tax=Paenibacillus aurantius TaxID=2918900 RepID=A0AA96LH73_9BACL|nr:carbohydrate ABC transporter permease [Paenibacillus aurantius]WNQ13189.1 carbohydrate ABC transporter permease [Paenibacillus aurantius]
MVQYRSFSRTLFQIFNYTFFLVFSLSILVPFINSISVSLSSPGAITSGKVGLWPVGFQLNAYKQIIGNSTFIRSFLNTVGLTAINTVLSVGISLCAAYALAHKLFVGRRVAFTYILITMFFSGGMIPTYLLVRGLGLGNTYWALILPGLVSPFQIILYKNIIDQLPKELMESAEMDGAGEFSLLFRIVLPLVLPMTMAFVIFSAVGHWNTWFDVLLYIKDKSMWTLQYQLREILSTSALQADPANPFRDLAVHPENVKMAALMITILPIVVIYPFVQKYFIHGQFVGAVKG